jgi:ATP-binding cassette subfamily F protein 3
MTLDPGKRGGNIVLRTKDLRVGFVDKPLFHAKDIELHRRECAAVIGPNGAGKTTLLRTLLSEIKPLSGKVQLGANLDVAYFRQSQEWFGSTLSVLEAFAREHTIPAGEARDYLARYLFCGDDVFKPVCALSGGEQSRLALAVLSLKRANLLLLDEPTNHLDVASQEVLEEALLGFEGTIVLVSHDRYLVDKLATQIWELGDGRLYVYKGSYGAYIEEKRRERTSTADEDVEKAIELIESQPVRGDEAGYAQALAQTEAQIEELESRLTRLGERLVAATEKREWEEVRTLTHEHDVARSRLDALLLEWAGLAEAVLTQAF